MKKILILLLVSVIILTLVSCSDNKKQEIEYDYSMIKTHVSSSAGMSVSYTLEDMTDWTLGFIEFTVLSEPEEITFEYVDQASIDEAIEQNYSEEDIDAIREMSTSTYTYPKTSIQVENVISEKEGCNLKEYDEIWLLGDAAKYSGSFVPGARFAAYVETMESGATPVDLYVNYYIFYIDENDNLIPFTNDPSLMQYKDLSVEKMADLTLEAKAAIEARSEEK